MQYSKSPDLNQTESETEIFLIETLYFLKTNHKPILIFGAVGVTATVTYLEAIPIKPKAATQMTMAQIAAANSNYTKTLGLISRSWHS